MVEMWQEKVQKLLPTSSDQDTFFSFAAQGSYK